MSKNSTRCRRLARRRFTIVATQKQPQSWAAELRSLHGAAPLRGRTCTRVPFLTRPHRHAFNLGASRGLALTHGGPGRLSARPPDVKSSSRVATNLKDRRPSLRDSGFGFCHPLRFCHWGFGACLGFGACYLELDSILRTDRRRVIMLERGLPPFSRQTCPPAHA